MSAPTPLTGPRRSRYSNRALLPRGAEPCGERWRGRREHRPPAAASRTTDGSAFNPAVSLRAADPWRRRSTKAQERCCPSSRLARRIWTACPLALRSHARLVHETETPPAYARLPRRRGRSSTRASGSRSSSGDRPQALGAFSGRSAMGSLRLHLSQTRRLTGHFLRRPAGSVRRRSRYRGDSVLGDSRMPACTSSAVSPGPRF